MNSRTPVQLLMLLGESGILLLSGTTMYVVMSRWGGAQLLGQYSLVAAWTVLFQVLGNFGIPEFITREIGRVGEAEGKYLGHGFILGLCSSGIACTVMAVVVTHLGYDTDITGALLVGIFTLIPVMVAALSRGAFLAHRKTQWIFAIASIEALVVIPLNALLIVSGHGVTPLFLVIAGGKVLSASLGFQLANRYAIRALWRFDVALVRELLPPIRTFALSNILGIVASRINIIMLSLWAPISAVGYYGAASKVAEVMLMFPVVFTHFMLPHLAADLSARHGEFPSEHRASLYLLFSVTMPLGIGTLVFAESIVSVLFGPGFAGAVLILRVLSLCFLLESVDMVTSVILKAAGHQDADVRMFAVNPVANAALSVVLLPGLGGMGAALSRLISAASSLGLRYTFMVAHLRGVRCRGVATLPVVASAAVIACTIPLKMYVPNTLLGLGYVLVTGLCLYLGRRIALGAAPAGVQALMPPATAVSAAIEVPEEKRAT